MNKLNNKKILFVIKTMEFGGGAEKALSTISDALNKDYEVSLLTFRKLENEYPFNVPRFNLEEEKMASGFFSKIFKAFDRAKKVSDFVKENNVDIVISFMKEANISVLLSKLFFRRKLKTLVVIQNDPKSEYPFVHKVLAKFFYPYADKIITISKEASSFFTLSPAKTVTIPNPISLEEIYSAVTDPLEKEDEKILSDGRILINIGRLVPQKNHLFLLEVFFDLSKLRSDIKLVIIGEGFLRKEIEERIKFLELDDKVFLLGRKRNVYRYLARSDIFVFSSKFEGQGIALLEAMAVGIPVVSNDCVSGPAETLGDTVTRVVSTDFHKDLFGIRVPFNNKDAFVKALDFLLSNQEEIEKYSALAKKRASDFDIANLLRKWREVID
jgi:glycosyltransferase involved in cell wall biosynthesis